MQISIPISPLRPPQVFPFHQPLLHTPKPPGVALQSHLNPVNSFRDSGLLSTIGVEEEYRRARSQVNRKGVDLEGYSIEGISVGGQETCVIIPEFKCAFDIGRCPSRAIQQNFVFITHAHLDHIGYVIYSVRKKLKKQYMHLKGKQIEKLKKSGVEITDTILSPEVAFTGDTTPDFMLDPRNADALRAKILITEATFLDEAVSIEHARQHGHTHIFEDIRKAVSKLQSNLTAKVVPLTEGFKSEY